MKSGEKVLLEKLIPHEFFIVLEITLKFYRSLFPRFRRPHGQTFGGWCATDWDRTPYLQIDFGQESVITAVATQGLDYPSGNWVKKYSLNYSCDGMNWETYQNMDKDTVHQTRL